MQEAQSVQVRAAGGPSASWPVMMQIPGSHCAKEDRIENSLVAVSAVVLLASLRKPDNSQTSRLKALLSDYGNDVAVQTLLCLAYLMDKTQHHGLHPLVANLPCFRPQPELYDTNRWPKRPYCTDDLESGIRVRGLAQALTKRYIQPNPPCLKVWSIYDIDRPGAAMAWEDAGMYPPSWVAENRENRHAHLAWGLAVPVAVGEAARQHPIRYLHGIETAYKDRLGADIGYSGLITKNPAHQHWDTTIFHVKAYTLEDLASCIEGFEKFVPKKAAKVAEVGLGRNLTVFYDVSAWAYKTIRTYKNESNRECWLNAVIAQCVQRNCEFDQPLPSNEIRHIAKSIAKWVWGKFDIAASDKRFSQLQAYRAAQKQSKGTRAILEEYSDYTPKTNQG